MVGSGRIVRHRRSQADFLGRSRHELEIELHLVDGIDALAAAGFELRSEVGEQRSASRIHGSQYGVDPEAVNADLVGLVQIVRAEQRKPGTVAVDSVGRIHDHAAAEACFPGIGREIGLGGGEVEHLRVPRGTELLRPKNLSVVLRRCLEGLALGKTGLSGETSVDFPVDHEIQHPFGRKLALDVGGDFFGNEIDIATREHRTLVPRDKSCLRGRGPWVVCLVVLEDVLFHRGERLDRSRILCLQPSAHVEGVVVPKDRSRRTDLDALQQGEQFRNHPHAIGEGELALDSAENSGWSHRVSDRKLACEGLEPRLILHSRQGFGELGTVSGSKCGQLVNRAGGPGFRAGLPERKQGILRDGWTFWIEHLDVVAGAEIGNEGAHALLCA